MEIKVKIDSKGRMILPPAVRKEIGNNPALKKTSKGHLITPSKQNDFIEKFNKLITSEPRRVGKPKLVTPEEMKSV